MNTRLMFAATALLSLAACSSGAEETAATDGAATGAAAAGETAATPAATPSADASATPDAGEPAATPTPGATPSATATPAPSASATTAARPTPAATTPAPRVAAAPPAAFATCGVCHSTAAGQNGVGPSLAGVVGRRSGSAAGYSYSPGMRGANVTWNDATLDRFLADPSSVAPGSSMPAPGLDAAARRAVITYLKTL